MKKIKVYTIGKCKEPWLTNALSDYEKRLLPQISFEWILAKDDTHLESLCAAPFIALDPNGHPHCSETFASFFNTASRHSFVIGGSEGLTPHLKSRATQLISLSPLTFTHQLSRLILLEQIYRAHQIHLGSPYHK